MELDKTLKTNITVDFVISGTIDSKEKIQDVLLIFNKIQFNLIENQIDLSNWMATADFAVTAAGSTVYELACLGVPQIVLIIDKNQEITGRNINDIGLGICLGDILKLEPHVFLKTFITFLNDETMKINMSSQAQTLIDGKGAERVADGILNYYGYT